MSDSRMERAFEGGLFRARWILAPFYLGLILAVGVLLAIFMREFVGTVLTAAGLTVEAAILKVLTLLDLTLAANLVLVVVLAGYENFVSKIDNRGHEDRPAWMGSTGFGGLKLKLYASIVAISAIQLLKSFMAINDHPADPAKLLWLTLIHFTFVVTALLSAMTDRWSRSAERKDGY